MRAQRLLTPLPIDRLPLEPEEMEIPLPGPHELLLRVRACGICHTDLHIVEGELPLPKRPLTPGHQVIGIVESTGRNAGKYRKGDRIGVPWLNKTCGSCQQCRAGRENLCEHGRFTGLHVDGGYAEYMVVPEESAYPIPASFNDADAAPLLCAGVIGYRALRLSEVKEGQRLGLYGFGASAHIALQIARFWKCEVFVFTRGTQHRHLARELGASWTGSAGELPPKPLQGAVIFAPAGELVPAALKALDRGGTLALAGIHMSPIPSFDYALLYHERTVRSVANSTRQDVRALLELAPAIPIRTEVTTFPLEEANAALGKLKRSEIRGSGVLLVE